MQGGPGTDRTPLTTTWPAFTEAIYLLVRAGGAVGRRALRRLVETGRLEITSLSDRVLSCTARLMEKNPDLPMDLADATLVTAAEQLPTGRIFTLDGGFRICRNHDRTAFGIQPTPAAGNRPKISGT